MVLSIPQELREPFRCYEDKDVLYKGFMKLSYDFLLDFIRTYFHNDRIDIACITFIHTHGRDGKYNPHLHIILGEGAYDKFSNMWMTFKHLPLNPLRRKWQYYLLNFVKTKLQLEGLITKLWNDHPGGFYVHPGEQSKVPSKSYTKLIKYLTRYLSSPPMGLSRIINYDVDTVEYRYKSHKTKRTEYETVESVTFIKLMMQHILPRGFQSVRYYGLQATKVFRKLYSKIADVAGDLVDRMLLESRLSYAQFFEEVANRNPLVCRYCGQLMELWQLIHPDKGVIYDLQDRIASGKRI